jgi:putative transposase
VKYEEVHLKRYESVRELGDGLTEFIRWYNEERIHSSLLYKKPAEVYCGQVGEVTKSLGSQHR